jgi:site-specific DNA-methyltransferase (adenine-specific)
MNTAVMFSSATDEWATPQDFFDQLNEEFKFTLDPCATHESAKCARYFTEEDNGLAQDWAGEVVFMNPPYGRVLGQWVKKAFEESVKGATVVCLLPARTDTRWFHDYIYNRSEIRFIKGRLKFGDSKNSAPFPSMVVIFNRSGIRI